MRFKYCILYITHPDLIPEEVKEGSHQTASILSSKYFVMKKSVEAPEKPVQEKNPRKPLPPKNERQKNATFRKPVVPITHVNKPIEPNDHDPLDDELPIPGRTDKEAGMNTPTQEPW